MTESVAQQVTCVVPTYNRPNYLRRLLFFMSELQSPIAVHVVDSSTSSCWKENEAVCREFSYQLEVAYEHVDLGVIEKFQAAAERVATRYVVFCADDDFVTPRSMLAGAAYLRAHPDHSCCGGAIVKVRSDGRGNRSELCRACDLTQDSPVERARYLAEHWFSTFYNVYQTRLLRENLAYTRDHCDFLKARIYPELMLAQLSALVGKVKVMPELHTVRQIHDANYGRLPSVEDRANSRLHYQKFQQALAAQYVRYGSISEDEALRLVDRGFGYRRHGRAKRPPLVRLRRELVRSLRKSLDRIHDTYLEGRPLGGDHVIRQAPAWQLASWLITHYPHGLSPSELRDERTRPPAAA